MATAYFGSQYFTSNLNVGGGIDASQTTGIIISDVSGLDITKPGVALFNYSVPLNTTLCEWVTYTSIDGSNELQGVTRGAEGYSAKPHDNNVAVAFPLSKSHINTLSTALSIGGTATNAVTTTLDEDNMATNSATALATQQSIKAYVDAQVATVSGGSIVDEDNAGTSSTSSSTLANITGGDVSVTITATSNIVLNANITAYGNVALAPYTIQWHDGTSTIGTSSRVYLSASNQRTCVSVQTIVTNKTAGTYTYTIQHKSEDNSSSLTAEAINLTAVAIPV